MSHAKSRWLCTLMLVLSLPAIQLAQGLTAEEELAARIAGAKTQPERVALLDSRKELVTPKLVEALVAEGDKLRGGGKFADAISVYTFAQSIAEKIGDRAEVALALDRTGNAYFRQDDFTKALEYHRRSLEIREQLGDKKAIAETLHNTGLVYQWQDEYDRAMEFYRKALALREEVGDRRGEAGTLNYIGIVFQSRGKYDLAAEHFHKSLKIKEEVGDKEGAAISFNSLGSLAYTLRDYTQAIEYFARALPIFEELGQKPRIAAVRGNLAQAHTYLGNYDLALELAQKSLADSGESRGYKSNAQNMLANLYFFQGNTALALEYYQKSLAMYEQIGVNDDIGDMLHNIAGVHARQGNYDLALEYYRRALEKRTPGEDAAETLNLIGDTYDLMGDQQHALEYLQKSRAIAEEIKDRQRIADLLNSFGDVYRGQGNLQKALDHYLRSLALYEELKAKRESAVALKNIADLYLQMNDPARALEYAERAITLTRELNQLVGRDEAYTTMGRALVAAGKPSDAERAFTDAIKVVEERRRLAAGGERDEQRFFEGRVSPYYLMAELLIGQNRLYEALAYAERAKGRVLLDVLQSGRANVTKSMTAQEQAQERRLSNDMISLNAQITRERQQPVPDAKRLEDLEKRVQRARLDYEAFETSLYASHPELKLRRGQPRIIEPTQSMQLLPDAKTALLEYVVTDERTYLFVLTKSGRADQTVADLKVYPIEIKRKELAARVAGFRGALGERDPGFAEPSKKFYDLLVAPARVQLQNRSDLVIVPDDALWELPFQALMPKPNRFLLEDSAVSYAPSLSVLLEMQNLRGKDPGTVKTGNSMLLAFGNPTLGKLTLDRARAVLRSGAALAPLPETENEVKGLAQIYGASQSRVYMRDEAREERAKEEAGKYSVLHFATHGVLNDASPMYSHIVLSQGQSGEDGLLEAWEITKLDLNASLVVLSACETARGRFGAGEGMMGLTWALFVAGSPATVVSQWKVDSATTKQLMLNFHTNLKAEPETSKSPNRKAESLRSAALSMMRNNEHRHPFYWASFVLIGDRR